MIIVSQDKEEIVNFDRIENVWIDVSGEGEFTIEATADTNSTLGHYKTKDRAKEVLQEIINKFMEYGQVQSLTGDIKQVCEIPKKYEMPKE